LKTSYILFAISLVFFFSIIALAHATLTYSFTTNGTVISEQTFGSQYVTIKVNAPKNNISISSFAFDSGTVFIVKVIDGPIQTNIGYQLFYSNIGNWTASTPPSVFLNAANDTVFVKALHQSDIELTFYAHYVGTSAPNTGAGALIMMALNVYIQNLGATLFFTTVYMTFLGGIYIKTKKIAITAAAGILGMGFYGGIISGYAVELVMLMVVFAIAGAFVILFRRNQW